MNSGLREKNLSRLKGEDFDVLVVGGGATGAGVALEAASRGLKTALIERDDFASETSSRSTKLLHGGVRYLEQAVLNLDWGQYQLVKDALKERQVLINNAPHLSRALPIITPIYSYLSIPYYLSGLKVYDGISGSKSLGKSHYISAAEALAKAPMMKAKGLRGAVVYFDGQFDDARMNLAIVQTAQTEGAAVANHVSLESLLKHKNKIVGAEVIDTLSQERWEIRTKQIINATGPFADKVRSLDSPSAKSLLAVSSGVHVVLPRRFSPSGLGVLIPKTEDGRVLFLLPWLGHTVLGTTDEAAKLTTHPKPTVEEVEYLCRHIKKSFSVEFSKKDILAVWSGLRPLVQQQGASHTAKLSRDHYIEVSESGLVTIVGGKWTTYRRMAEDAVNEGIKAAKLQPQSKSRTEQLKLVGAKDYDPGFSKTLVKEYDLPEDIAAHLNGNYGDRCMEVIRMDKEGALKRIAPGHPFTEAEIKHAAVNEFAETGVDILARRLRLGFLDYESAKSAIPRVVQLLGRERGWDEARQEQEIQKTTKYFQLRSLKDLQL